MEKTKAILSVLFVCILAISIRQAKANEGGKDLAYDDLSLEELLDIPITVASKKGRDIRQSPAVVTVITDEEIKKMGARDLTDVLDLVPGIFFGVDVTGVVGIGIRGNWGQEGKVLLLLDGQEFNENLYSSVPYANHFPIDQIKRIEIIRGPGSAIYGGYAELAVINIITKAAEDVGGVSASGIYTQSTEAYGRRNLYLSFGRKFKELDDLSVVLHGFVGQGNLSDRTYWDVYGNSFDMADNNNYDPLMINLGIGYKDLSLRFIFDYYRISHSDSMDEALDHSVEQKFISYFAEAKYDIKILDNLALTPKINYKMQKPWNFKELIERAEVIYYDVENHRLSANLTLSYYFGDYFDILVGAEYYFDYSKASPDYKEVHGAYNQETGGDAISNHNISGFAEAVVYTIVADITGGVRLEQHSKYGFNVSPRAALTKLYKGFHYKLLFARAFRAPGNENLNSSPEIKSEKTTVFEAELGYQFTKNLFLSVNYFENILSDPIVYFFDSESADDGYDNFGSVGTRGVEAVGKIKYKRGYLNLGYSYYRLSKNEVDYYRVESDDTVALGFPSHKFSMSGSLDIVKDLSINPSLIVYGERYGFDADPYALLPKRDGLRGTAEIERETFYLRKFSPTAVVNLFLLYQNMIVEGLSAGIGVYNLFDADVPLIQPYDGGHAPLPGPSREFLVKLEYNYKF